MNEAPPPEAVALRPHHKPLLWSDAMGRVSAEDALAAALPKRGTRIELAQRSQRAVPAPDALDLLNRSYGRLNAQIRSLESRAAEDTADSSLAGCESPIPIFEFRLSNAR